MWKSRDAKENGQMPRTSFPDKGPIEPEGAGPSKMRFFRWLFIVAFILYVLLTALRIPILTGLGRYLVVEHKPSKSDLIVCLAGGNVERALGTAEVYRRGLAARIFVAPEENPDGFDVLMREGIEYPRSVDLLVTLLQKLGVPNSGIVAGRRPVRSTLEEASAVRDFVIREKARSLILVTSPTHSRRVHLTFKKVFEGEDVRIQVVATPYSGFKPETWWESRKYIRKVILEYQKLIFYVVKDLRE
ncbi:MAG: YdcF family protein [Deltaproteobacteria bacterium]|nr:YdcF family protein [Deltaproteobacteria bacterium]